MDVADVIINDHKTLARATMCLPSETNLKQGSDPINLEASSNTQLDTMVLK
jgi:hypothetical protein